ncbi:MAG: Uma2 family endonuclease [Clostridiales bacterium]|jgi:Uma2 family endonuclease|nr:Uma2 family endonuclease [Clostridiales bacterium]
MSESALQIPRDYELINGKIFMMSRPVMNHVAIATHISAIFYNFLKGRTCASYLEPDVFLDDENNFIPDVVILCDRSKRKSRGIYGAPDLVVEILSPATAKKDLTEKKEIYGKHGVKEYWIVNPLSKSISVYYLNGNSLDMDNIYHYVPVDELDDLPNDDRNSIVPGFKTSLFEDLVIDLEEVFSGVE